MEQQITVKQTYLDESTKMFRPTPSVSYYVVPHYLDESTKGFRPTPQLKQQYTRLRHIQTFSPQTLQTKKKNSRIF